MYTVLRGTRTSVFNFGHGHCGRRIGAEEIGFFCALVRIQRPNSSSPYHLPLHPLCDDYLTPCAMDYETTLT